MQEKNENDLRLPVYVQEIWKTINEVKKEMGEQNIK